MVVNDFA